MNVDFKQMGVGGDTSWGWRARPHPEYSLPALPYAYEFLLCPFVKEDGPLPDLGLSGKISFPDEPAVPSAGCFTGEAGDHSF